MAFETFFISLYSHNNSLATDATEPKRPIFSLQPSKIHQIYSGSDSEYGWSMAGLMSNNINPPIKHPTYLL